MSQVPIPVAVKGRAGDKEQADEQARFIAWLAMKVLKLQGSSHFGETGFHPSLCTAKSNAILSIYFTMILGDRYFCIIWTHFPKRILQSSERLCISSEKPQTLLGEEVSPLGNPDKF